MVDGNMFSCNSRLKGLFGYWITINEPVASIVGIGYIAGLFPPGFFLNGKRAKLALTKNTEKVTISSSYVQRYQPHYIKLMESAESAN